MISARWTEPFPTSDGAPGRSGRAAPASLARAPGGTGLRSFWLSVTAMTIAASLAPACTSASSSGHLSGSGGVAGAAPAGQATGGAPGGSVGGGAGPGASGGAGGSTRPDGAGGVLGGRGGRSATAGGAGGGPGATGAAGASAAGGTTVGTGGAGGADTRTGGVDWEPWPAVDSAPAGTCAVTTIIGGDVSTAAKSIAHETWEFDGTNRILTRRHAASGSAAAWVGYMRLDPQARREMVCHAAAYFDCEEWTRDSLGNSTGYSVYGVVVGPFDASALDPAHPPVKGLTPDLGGDSERHRLTYDENGRLETASYAFPVLGASLSFARDDQGRCSDVTWQVGTTDPTKVPARHEVDHWTYQGGQLTSRVVTNLDDPTDVRAVMTYGYAADGTLATTVIDGRLDIPQDAYLPTAKRDGVTDYVVRTVKLPDGSRWVEIVDFVASSPNAKLVRDGTPTAATRYRWNFSPACDALPLPRHTSQDCEFERPTPMMPVGWSNPLVTPLPMWTPSPLPD